MRIVLHTGCGTHNLPAGYVGYQEVRLDIDPLTRPNVVASITDMPIESRSVDLILCLNTLEHVYSHEVPMALREFLRVLRPGGRVELAVPDLEKVLRDGVEFGLEHPLYESPCGPITALDMLYGHRASVAMGQRAMQHKTGFTRDTLAAKLEAAGFGRLELGFDRPYSLFATAWKG